MSQVIPVAPGKKSGEEEVLSELEETLNATEGLTPPEADQSGKVELDRADLPVFDAPIETEEAQPPDPQVDMGLHPAALEGGDLHASTDPEAAEADQAQREQEAKNKKKKLIIIGGAGLLLLIVLGVVFWLFLAPAEEPESDLAVVAEPMPSLFQATRQDLTPFIIPLKPTRQGNLLRVVVMVELTDPEALAALQENTLVVRDAVYLVMRDRTADELFKARNDDHLQNQIKDEINKALEKGIISQIYFKEFFISG